MYGIIDKKGKDIMDNLSNTMCNTVYIQKALKNPIYHCCV